LPAVAAAVAVAAVVLPGAVDEDRAVAAALPEVAVAVARVTGGLTVAVNPPR
jgi:hypothetical protein